MGVKLVPRARRRQGGGLRANGERGDLWKASRPDAGANPQHPLPAVRPLPTPARPTLWGSDHRRALQVGAVLGTLVLLSIALETGMVGLLAGFALASLPVPLYLSLALWVDRFEAEPPRLLVRAFAWGAIVAALFSEVLNAAAFGLLGSEFLGAVLAAPLAEELSKGLALLLLYEWEHDEFDNLTDGVIYAVMVGLGFAMTENVLYYGMAFAEGDASGVWALRGAVFPFAHPLFTAMLGMGLGWAREARTPSARRMAPALGLGAAILLHAGWNLAAEWEGVFWAVYAGLMVPIFAAVLWVVACSLRREAEVLRLELAPLVAAGLLPPHELETLCDLRARLRAEWGALRAGGLPALRRRLRFHHAAGDLALLRWRRLHLGADADGREGRYLAEIAAHLRGEGLAEGAAWEVERTG